MTEDRISEATTEPLTLEQFREAVEALKAEPLRARFYPAWMLPLFQGREVGDTDERQV